MARTAASAVPTFRPLTADDLPMLHDWIYRPHVRKWWLAPSTIEELRNDYLAPESTTRAHMVVLDDRPIGFAQSYVVMGSGGGANRRAHERLHESRRSLYTPPFNLAEYVMVGQGMRRNRSWRFLLGLVAARECIVVPVVVDRSLG